MTTLKNIQAWIQVILEKPFLYEGKFVVHNPTDVFFASENPIEAEQWVEENQKNSKEKLYIFLVPRHFQQVRLRMLKIKSLWAGEWMPTYPVVFFLENGKTVEYEMLVDSGADITFIPKKLGERLGFIVSHGETISTALGVGSEVAYLMRENRIKIDNIEFSMHLLWGQDETVSDILLGRLDIFDHFEVTFNQRQKQIIFKPYDEIL